MHSVPTLEVLVEFVRGVGGGGRDKPDTSDEAAALEEAEGLATSLKAPAEDERCCCSGDCAPPTNVVTEVPSEERATEGSCRE